MDNIVYEEENVTEEVYRGEVTLDEHMTLEQRNQAIFNEMRKAGIKVINEDEYHINYSNNGKQKTHYVVTRTYKKPIPYKITREEIYSGELPQDTRVSEEERKRRIINMMKRDHVKYGNEKDLEFIYDGAYDNDGISETLLTKFTVIRVVKERLDKKGFDSDMSDEEKMQRIHDELVALKEKVLSTEDPRIVSRLFDRMSVLSNELDALVSDSTRDYTPFIKTLEKINEQIAALEKEIDENMKSYNASYERIKEIIIGQTDALSHDLTPEELDEKVRELMGEKSYENNLSLSLRSEIDKQVSELKALVKKRDRVRRDFEAAEELGLSAAEYKEITDNFRTRKLAYAIIEEKGLGDILAIPEKERTAEQRRKIRTVRREIIEELANAKKENADKSVLDLVEALYGIEVEVQLKGKQRVLIVKPKSLENIRKNAQKMPEKIKVTEDVSTAYVPGDAPEDMKDVMERRELESKGLIDKFTFFRDPKNPEKVYARAAVFARFAAIPQSEEVRINGERCYEIDNKAVERIVANASNETYPYIVEYSDVDIDEVGASEENEDVKVKVKERNPEDESDEYIPGTNFKKPRNRGVKESDEEYVEFLRNYYNDIFGNADEEIAEDTYSEEEDTASRDTTNIEDISNFEDEEEAQSAISEEEEDIPSFTIEDVPQESNDEEISNDVPPVDGSEVEVDTSTTSDNLGSVTIDDIAPVVEEETEYIPGTQIRKPRDKKAEETDQEYIDYLKNYYKKYFNDNRVIDHPTINPPSKDEIDSKFMNHNILKEGITIFEDGDGKYYVYKPVFDRFDVEPIGEEVDLNGVKGYEIASEDVDDIVAEQNNSTSPYVVEFKSIDFSDVKDDEIPIVESDEKLDRKGLKDLITIYRDKDVPNKFYAYKPVFDRFDVEPIGEEVDLNGIKGFEILAEDVDDIVNNQNNDYSPYDVDFREISFAKENPVPSTGSEPVPPTIGEDVQSGNGLTDLITIYKDKDVPNKFYAYKPVFDRFDVEPIGEEVDLNGIKGFEILSEDVDDIVANQNNDYSPYKVEFREISFAKENPVPPTGSEVEPEKDTEIITLFRDLNDNGQVYAPDEVMKKFGIKALAAPTMIQGKACHKISSDTDQIINSIARMSKNPKLVVKYIDVRIKEIEEVKPRPHVEEILDKLTTGLDIRAKDCKRYKASNLKISKGFRDELHSGNCAYNIVHIIPATLKAGINFFRKLSGNLLSNERSIKAMKTIEERLASLSDEELEVLFEEYKGSQLKTDMNNQINPLILDTLRSFGLRKVALLNDQIAKDYAALFTLLGQIKALEEKMQKDGKESGSIEAQRKVLMSQASKYVQSIIDSRKKANNLLSSGVHGLEEDFKAVATKLSYVGMRFGKTNDFDTDLQHQLGAFGRRLNTAISQGDDEAIVQNFMGLESCYYENTEIRGSIAGKRSVGSKYYSPIAEQFDYRDDPFIRDLFTTVAVTSAAVSAINAVRVHQIEVHDKQAEIDAVNAQNQATMDSVHQAGRTISSKRGTFQNGMEAQAQQDILTNANVRERAHLDTTNWQFNDAYHAADAAGHAAYNQFNIDVNNQINSVMTSYAQGAISEAQALEMIANISNNAHATLTSVVDSCLPILRQYASTHPQFDLTAVEQSMQYISAHPQAIADMNQAMVDVTNIGDALQGLQASALSPLGDIPSDMATTIICAASAALLAGNVARSMSQGARKKGTYGNDVTDMLDEYLYGSSLEEEEEKINTR